MAYKMKGSPMQRNFGISPIKQAVGGGAGEAIEHHKKYKANKPKWDPTKRQGGDWIKEARKQKAASTKDVFHEHVKIVKSRGKSLVKKGLKKAGKFLGGKALGVAGMMMATSSKADQPKSAKKSEGEQIRGLLTKHKLKGGRK